MLHRQSVTRAALFVAPLIVAVASRSGPSAIAQTNSAPTFAREVAPIVYGHCAVCHRPGQAAPFPLLSYDDVKRRGALIVAATARRYMPPWHATPSPGFPEFRDDRRLSDADVAMLKSWFDTGMAAGDLTKAPQPPVFPAGWTLGQPDVVLTFPHPIEVPADGPDLYRNVVLPLDLPADQWITAIDYEPSARRAVHHALFFLAPANEVAGIGENDVLPGISARSLLGGRAGRGGRGGGQGGGAAGIGGWVPGMTPRFFPDGVAQSLPAHTSVVAQLHLHPSGKAEREEGRIAIYFAKQPPAKSLTSIQVPPTFGFAMGIDIPAGERRYAIKDSLVLPVDVEALGARGHAHYLAREMKMTATLPDGSTKGLLWIGDWDFGWQDSYFYTSPIVLPKGTRLDVEIAYDNSADNARNPSTPPKRVVWGLGSFDEMGSMSLLAAAPAGPDRAALRDAQAAHFREQLIARYLRNR
jgi:mono/diheme cytochrome c family protein